MNQNINPDWNIEDTFYDSFCYAFSKSTQINNLLKIYNDYGKYHNSYPYTPNDLLKDLSDLRNFAERIPVYYGYLFHEGDSFLISGEKTFAIGYSDTHAHILSLLEKGGYDLESAQKLCDRVTNILDVTPFRRLPISPIDDIHIEQCRCCDCEFKKTNQKLIELQLSYEQISKKNIIIGIKNPITGPIRHEVFKRDRYRCCDCGATNQETTLEIDHIIPKSQGGTDELNNLQTLCKACNRAKHNRYWEGGQ